MQKGKRILKVMIKSMVDESPDSSYYGEYSQRQTSKFSIDRDHREDCASIETNHREALDKLERVLSFLQGLRESPEVSANPDSEEWEPLDNAIDAVTQAQEEVQECDCGGDHCPRNEYRYFNPSFNYVTKADEPQAGLTVADVVKYTRQDYERMESAHAGNWCYIGIRAEAEIGIGDVREYPSRFNVTCQRITSGGLWGIESDSSDSDLEEIKEEQLEDLKLQLQALGFGKRAIATAFKVCRGGERMSEELKRVQQYLESTNSRQGARSLNLRG